MNYEKKYKEALDRAKMEMSKDGMKNDVIAIHLTETIFPELKKDENEMIREELIKHLKEGSEGYEPAGGSSDYKRWITWLERQGELPIYNIPSKEIILAIWDLGNEWKELTGGSISTEYDTQLNYIQNHWHESEYYLKAMQNEQKLIDKNELKSKFKVGDWVVDKNGTIQQILSYKDGIYKHTNGYSSKIFEDEWRLWDITKDAKDSDVLVNGSNIFIFHFINDTRLMGYCHVNTDDGRFYDDIGKNECFCLIDAVVNPATKEQRDLLFTKMKEAGYEWDNSTKELKRIEEELQLKKGKYYKCIKSYHYLGCGEYWFDEGKVYFCEKDGYLRSDPYHLIKVDDCKNWQSYFCPYIETFVWEEEDEEMLKSIIATCELAEQERDSSPAKHLLEMQLNWLKSIKEKIIEL